MRESKTWRGAAVSLSVDYDKFYVQKNSSQITKLSLLLQKQLDGGLEVYSQFQMDEVFICRKKLSTEDFKGGASLVLYSM